MKERGEEKKVGGLNHYANVKKTLQVRAKSVSRIKRVGGQ